MYTYCLFLCLSLQIRTMMIDGETGERTIDTLVKTQDEVRVLDTGVRWGNSKFVWTLLLCQTLIKMCCHYN